MSATKITSKGQITIPKELREKYHLFEGEKAVLIPTPEGVLVKHEVNPLRELRGLMRQEIDLKKAIRFLDELRKEWRVE